MRRTGRIVTGLLLALAVAGLAQAQGAQDPLPRNDGWVTDLAGFLTPQEERSLEELMESYKQGSDNEIALLTVPDLGGRSLEQYALEVGRAWGIGEQGSHNGALLFVAKQERKVRIEVGRGLEGNLTDSISGRIIRDVIAPDFKQGRFYAGLRAGIEAMHAAAGGDYGKIPRGRGARSSRGVGVCSLPMIFFILFLINAMTRGRRGGGGRGGSGGGILPWLVLGSMMSGGRGSSGWHGGSSGGGGSFGGFGGGGGFSGGGSSGGW